MLPRSFRKVKERDTIFSTDLKALWRLPVCGPGGGGHLEAKAPRPALQRSCACVQHTGTVVLSSSCTAFSHFVHGASDIRDAVRVAPQCSSCIGGQVAELHCANGKAHIHIGPRAPTGHAGVAKVVLAACAVHKALREKVLSPAEAAADSVSAKVGPRQPAGWHGVEQVRVHACNPRSHCRCAH
jgi:hypothetical protein